MKRSHVLLGCAAFVGALTSLSLGAGPASPPKGGLMRYEVTVTNLTRGQPFSPVLVAGHTNGFELFTLGAPASPELALLAEDGDNSALAAMLEMNASVGVVESGAAPFGPGESQTIEIEVDSSVRFISAASMLVNTNDSFLGLRGFALPMARQSRTLVPAFDAGSEANNEDCDFIPGPACGSAGVGDPVDAEGFVHINAGVHGIADLEPSAYDWRNPVAEIVVRRVR